MRDLYDEFVNGGGPAVRNLLGREEAVDFDCKLKASPDRPTLERDDKHNLGKTLSAFANSIGGLLLWGLDARFDQASEIDRIVGFQPISNLKRFKHELERLSTEALMPRLTDIPIAAIPDTKSPDQGFVAMYVQRSERRPHRCELEVKGYYRRAGSSSRMMEHFEIEDAFKRNATPELSLEWRIERGGQLRGPTGSSSFFVWLRLANQSLVSAQFPYVYVSGIIQPFLHWDGLSRRGLTYRAENSWMCMESDGNVVINLDVSRLIGCFTFDAPLTPLQTGWSIRREQLARRISVRYGCMDSRMRQAELVLSPDEFRHALADDVRLEDWRASPSCTLRKKVIEMADVLKVKGFHRVNTASGERIAYANVLLACWNGPITLQFPVPDAATEHQLLESTRARLIDLFREAMAQLERGPIPLP